jgi:hypothetical protein
MEDAGDRLLGTAGTRTAGEVAQCAVQSVVAGPHRRRSREFRVEHGAWDRRRVRRTHVRVGLGKSRERPERQDEAGAGEQAPGENA